MVISSESQARIDLLSNALSKMKSITSDATRCCDQLSKRAHHLDSLTSPASGASSLLSRANNNLTATLVLMKDAREKFDTVSDCEPAIDRLYRGVMDMEEKRGNQIGGGTAMVHQTARKGGKRGGRHVVLTEQDVYAAGDSMEILRDAYDYFHERQHYMSAPTALEDLSRVHQLGVESMCKLISLYLMAAGQPVRPKRGLKKDWAMNETAIETRERLSAALQNRDLLKSIGDYEEYQPVESRAIREIRAIFECLGCHGYSLSVPPSREPPGLKAVFGVPPNKVLRTEKVGSGCYTSLTRDSLQTGFPQLDAYGEARKNAAFASIDSYYRRIKQDRKKRIDAKVAAAGTANERSIIMDADDDADEAARDACRCLEHAMIVVAGEKTVYRAIVAPFVTKPNEDLDADEDDITPLSQYLRKACVAAYSHSVASVVDRALDIIETVFLKEGGIGQASGAKGGEAGLTVRTAANAAAAGLRILDGVRMLGPSLAKLCEMSIGDNYTSAESTSIASILCIAIHRTTVKNAARTLENLAKAIQDDPLKGLLHRPKDASISTVTSDTVRAIRLVSPFVSAYKSVSKRRALPWDPNMGDEAGELDSFVRFLVMRLLNSLKGKALHYIRDGFDDSQAKSNLFLINNCHYLLQQLGPASYSASNPNPSSPSPHDDNHNDTGANGGNHNNPNNTNHSSEQYRIEGSWFIDKVNKILESEKLKYLGHWEVLNTHLTALRKDDFEYQKNDNILTWESGRLIKNRFSGFNEDFERIYSSHQKLMIIDIELKRQLQKDVEQVFMPRYERFYEKYKKIRFSKRKQDEYTKYDPTKITTQMIPKLFVLPGE